MSNIDDKLIQLAETKSNIRDAIISKGVEVSTSLPFGEYADKIKKISGGFTGEIEVVTQEIPVTITIEDVD